MLNRLTCAFGMTLIAAGPVSAQDDWEMTHDPEQDQLVAHVAFTDGLAVATRCAGETFDVILAGLPRSPRGSVTRTIEIGLRDQPVMSQSWTNSADGEAIFSRLPARFARDLRAGGLLQIQISAEGREPARRYAVELPPSPTAINETLLACDRPLEDTRLPQSSWMVPEGGEPAGYSWLRQPRPTFPEMAARAGVPHAIVAVSCVRRADGRLEDCEIESEMPGGFGFGSAALRSIDEARITAVDGSEIPDSIVVFSINFRLEQPPERRIRSID